MGKNEINLSEIETYISEEKQKNRDDLLLRLEKFNFKNGKDLMQSIEKILQKYFNKYSKDGIITTNELLKYYRLENLLKEIIFEMKVENKTTKANFLTKMQEIGYKENLLYDYLLYSQFDINNVSEESKKELTEILDYFGKGTFQEYFDNALNDSIFGVKRGILGIIKDSGTTFNKLSDVVKEKLNSFIKRNNNIYQNEANKVFNIRDIKRYEHAEKIGLKFKKVWLSTLDLKTRNNHKLLDGQVADKNGYFTIGGNKTLMPKLFGISSEDVNCRCTTLALFDNLKYDERRENTGNKKVINSINYGDWYKKRFEK